MVAMKLWLSAFVAVLQPGDAAFHNNGGLSSLRSVKRMDLGEEMHTELIQLTNASGPIEADKFAAFRGSESDQDDKSSDPRYNRWPDTTGGWTSWVFAALFIALIAQIPITLHILEFGLCSVPPMICIISALALFAWLTVGLALFTQVIIFQSPHFDYNRPLTLIEAVYLFSQIFTTVGYGDITPAHVRGQVTVGIFVFVAIMLIADMVSQLSAILVQKAEENVKKHIEKATSALGMQKKEEVIGQKPEASVWPVVGSLATFFTFVIIGTVFFHFYPGEGKTVGQGVYMGIITLTTVGFGAFTPVTQAGMVFGAFWMLFGVAALGAAVASFTAWTVALKKSKEPQLPDINAAAEMLRNDCATGNGRVDKLGYMKYALVKWDLVNKEELDKIMQQFESFQTDASGTVDADLILSLSAR